MWEKLENPLGEEETIPTHKGKAWKKKKKDGQDRRQNSGEVLSSLILKGKANIYKTPKERNIRSKRERCVSQSWARRGGGGLRDGHSKCLRSKI